MSYYEMNQLFINNDKPDMTKVFEYAAQDVRVLHQLHEKTGYLQLLIDVARLTETSIIDALHKTDTALLAQKIQRELLSVGKQLPYHHKTVDTPQKYDGAANWNLNEPVVYNNVTSYDFTSLYPNCQMYNDLCLSTYLGYSETPTDEFGTNVRVIETTDLQNPKIKYQYYKNESGIIPWYIKHIFEKKQECDRLVKTLTDPVEISRNNSIWNAYKLLINKIYGSQGSQSSSLYCLPIALCVTYTGRKIFNQTCKILDDNGVKIIFGDTDSVMVETNGGSDAIRIGNLINTKISEFAGSDHFIVKTEDTAVWYFAPKNVKKCYIKLTTESDSSQFNTIDFNDIVINPVDFVNSKFKVLYPKYKLHCKSFSWSLLPEGQIPYFWALCMSILCCNG